MSIANKTIVIAAVSSRIYAEAAVKAGFNVIAIDAFCDMDLIQSCVRCYQVKIHDNQLDSTEVLNITRKLDRKHLFGFCYGAGFEANPEVLHQINQELTVLGNAPEVVSRCKQPSYFFGLCRQLNIPYPEVVYEYPLDSSDWLEKRVGGSGGAHVIKIGHHQTIDSDDIYYQRFQKGNIVSCLFLVVNGRVEIIGFNSQWADAADKLSYRYGGAMSYADIDQQTKASFIEYVHQLASELGLRGVNSCDAVYDGEKLYILEINPRLSASVDFYQEQAVLQKHIAAFEVSGLHNGQAAIQVNEIDSLHVKRAHQIVYAMRPLTIGNDITWPSWVHDVPHAGQQFSEGMPICSVSAEANASNQLYAGLKQRTAWVERQLLIN